MGLNIKPELLEALLHRHDSAAQQRQRRKRKSTGQPRQRKAPQNRVRATNQQNGDTQVTVGKCPICQQVNRMGYVEVAGVKIDICEMCVGAAERAWMLKAFLDKLLNKKK